jgi:hypothetical protein
MSLSGTSSSNERVPARRLGSADPSQEGFTAAFEGKSKKRVSRPSSSQTLNWGCRLSGPPQMTPRERSDAAVPVPQEVATPLTRSAVFLIVSLIKSNENRATIRSLCADMAALVRAVGFRELNESLSCVTAFGSAAWDELFGLPHR